MKQPPSPGTGTDAVGYLRVSSVGQVETDYNPEGISLPAQREAVRERASELRTALVAEFTDPGKSAKSIEKREAFREMIAYLRANPNVRYVIVYALSRFARNRYDDAVMMMTLEKLGVTLVSTTERNLDESPAGRAMHGMIAVFNEYQVLVSGEDIRYKMGQKVKNGGSVGVAKIGYRNVRLQFEGREVRTIDVDPDRGHLVRMAFELYATGNYGFHDLRDALTDAGLRTKGTRRYGPRPVSLHSLGNLLRDRYYLGYVTHDGIEYPGRHEPLITPEVFDRVQRVLDAERGGGTRERVHDHYLKGTIWCGRCRRRLILRPSTGKSGRRYFYFICRGNQEGGCDLPSLPVDKVERAVGDHYAVVSIPAEHREKLDAIAADAIADAHSATARLRTSLRAQLAELDRQEDRYLDLIGDPDWPQDKIKARLQKAREDKQKTVYQLDNVLDDLTPGHDALRAALELLDRPRELYRAAPDDGRKKLNKALFNRLYLDAEDRTPTTTRHDLIEPYASLVDATRGTHDGPKTHLGGLLATALQGGCASKAAMVELRGIEPLTFSMRTRRATNCATAPVPAVPGGLRKHYQPPTRPPHAGSRGGTGRPGRGGRGRPPRP
jgi:site-specific DNA recombinase